MASPDRNNLTNERTQAIAIANRWMDEPYADPDDDFRVLARQFLRAVEPKGPLDTEFDIALRRAGVREPLEVYNSNSFRRVGLKSEYKVVLSATRHKDGTLDISNTTLLEALVVAFNAMLVRHSSENREAE